MFCGNCGSKLEDGATVCDKCGFKLVEEATKATEDVKEKVEEVVTTVVEKTEDVSLEKENKHDKKKADKKKDEKTEAVEAVVEVPAQVTNDVVPVDSNAGNGEKKKSKLPLIITAAVAGVVAIIAIIFLCSASLRNSVKKAFMSDDSYYRSVQKEALMGISEKVLAQYGKLVGEIDPNNSEYKISANLSVEKEAEDFLDKVDSQTRNDFTWLKKSALELVFGIKDSKIYANADFDINKKDMAQLELKADIDGKKAYIGLPMLSDTYAAFDMGSEDEENTDITSNLSQIMKALPSQKDLNRLAERYLDVILESISKVKVTDDKVVKVAGVSTECTKMVVNLDADDLTDIEIKILEKLQDDNEVAAIINKLNANEILSINYDDFLDGIEKELNILKDYNRTNIEARIETYVDSTGDVCSFDLTFFKNGGADNGGTNESIGYRYADNAGNYGFEAYNTTTTRRSTYNNFYVKASGTRSGSKLTGTVDFVENNRNNGHLDYNELNLSDLLNGVIDGQFLFNMYEKSGGDKLLRNIVVKVEAKDVAFSKGTIVVNVYDNKVAIGSLEIDYKKGSGSSVKLPSKTDDINGATDITDWVDSFNWEKTLKNMESADLPNKVIRMFEKVSNGDLSAIMGMIGGNVTSGTAEVYEGSFGTGTAVDWSDWE